MYLSILLPVDFFSQYVYFFHLKEEWRSWPPGEDFQNWKTKEVVCTHKTFAYCSVHKNSNLLHNVVLQRPLAVGVVDVGGGALDSLVGVVVWRKFKFYII